MLFLISSWYSDSEYLLNVARSFSKKHPEKPVFVVSSSGYFLHQYAQAKESDANLIINFNEYVSKAKKLLPDTSSKLQYGKVLSEKFKLTILKEIWRSDPFTVDSTNLDQNNDLVLYFCKAWELIFEKHKPSFIYSEVGGAMIRRSAFKMAHFYGAKYFEGTFAPFANRFFLTKDFTFDVDEPFHKIKHVTNEAIEVAKNLLVQYANNRDQYAIINEPKINEYKRRQFIEYFKIHKYERENQQWHFGTWIKTYVSKYVRSRLRMFVSYSPLPSKNPFIFFPLHSDNDSQVLVRAQHITSQTDLIKQIAHNLPYGYKLVVKPHPSSIGSISLDYINSIKKIPDVLFVSPLISASEIIQKSKAVFVLNSTTGFEAILAKKPVLNYASIYYKGKGLTYDIYSPYEIGAKITEAIEKGFPGTSDDLIQFIAKLYMCSFEGKSSYWGNARLMTLSKDLNDNHDLVIQAERLADVLHAKFFENGS